jgi:3-dehydroquinate synthase
MNEVVHSSNIDQSLADWLERLNPDKSAVLVDENTKKYCLSRSDLLADLPIIEIRSGEVFKNLKTCEYIWNSLTELGFTRKSLLINLGGGVIGDMGGFCAATYKRGIRFINLPTTLLAQVDASVGGKLGIDFNGLKNHIGVFQEPATVIIDSIWLQTLPIRQLRSGFAEVLKHGLIADKKYWNDMISQQFPEEMDWRAVVKRSIELKAQIVAADPTEKGLRKILNFGHTLGHAIESWNLDQKYDLLHGEAIAAGMVMESHLSWQKNLINQSILTEIAETMIQTFGKVKEIPPYRELKILLQQDKKNELGQVMFSLIEGKGHCRYDQTTSEGEVISAIEYYQELNE